MSAHSAHTEHAAAHCCGLHVQISTEVTIQSTTDFTTFNETVIIPGKYQRSLVTNKLATSSRPALSLPDSLFMTETGVLRFARDYGIVPHLVTKSELRELYRQSNHTKCFVSSRLPVREQVVKAPLSAAQPMKL
jgi:hypothetical protein